MGSSNKTLGYDSYASGPATLVTAGSVSGNAWWGRTIATSDTGGVSAVISTQLVNSGSLIFFSIQNLGTSGVGSAGATWQVNTIANGGFFKIATNAAGSYAVMWELKNGIW